MSLLRAYLCFWIAASMALYASAFMAMAAVPEKDLIDCCANASLARTEGSREQDLTISFVAPKGHDMHDVYVEMYDAKRNLVLQTTTHDSVIITRLPSGEYYGTAKHAGASESFHASVHMGIDGVTVVQFDA